MAAHNSLGGLAGWMATAAAAGIAIPVLMAAVVTPPALAQPADPVPALEACSLEVSPIGNVVWRGNFSQGFDPFGRNDHLEVFELVVTHEGEACDFFVTIRPTQQRGDLGFTILDGPNGQRVTSRDVLGIANARLEGSFPDGPGGEVFPLFIRADAGGPSAQSGLHRIEYVVSVFADEPGLADLQDQTTFAVSARVPPSLDLALGTRDFAGPPRDVLVDFGVYRGPDVRTVDMFVRSNERYEISIKSENGGQLKHRSVQAFVDYTLELDGRAVPLSDRDLRVLESGPTGDLGNSHRLSVAIGRLIDLPAAGVYEDIITITATAMR